MRHLATFCTLGVAPFFGACVSTETMSSANLKAKSIAQTYSVQCTLPARICAEIAQFRVGDNAGDTIELKLPSRIRINGSDATFHDTRATNRAFDAFSLITFVPMFKLLKSGSFYARTESDAANHAFEFNDDEKRIERIEVTTRALAADNPAKLTRIENLQHVSFKVVGGLEPSEKLYCVLTVNPDGALRTWFVNAKPEAESYACVFKGRTELFPRGAEPFTVRVIRSLAQDRVDSAGRTVRVEAVTELVLDGKLAR